MYTCMCRNGEYVIYTELIKRKNQVYYYDSNGQDAINRLAARLFELINEHRKEGQTVVILCIGSDRFTGDSLGPLIGYKLSTCFICAEIFGTLESPIHAINLSDTLDLINKKYINPFIISIDASLGKAEHIGFITLRVGPLKPGLGVKKNLPEVGDLSITGIVNVSGVSDTMTLQSTRLSSVMNMADCIAGGLTAVF